MSNSLLSCRSKGRIYALVLPAEVMLFIDNPETMRDIVKIGARGNRSAVSGLVRCWIHKQENFFNKLKDANE